ncbi:MAG: DUF7544 domain-containing protein [Anaerolineales bacterium]
MDIGAVLTRAWNITWKYKVLWLLGVLAGCSASGRGSGGQFPSGFQGYDFSSGDAQGPPAEGMQQFIDRLSEGAWIPIVIGVILLVIFVSLVFLVLGVLGQAGLIAAFGRADDGHDITLGEAFRLGGEHFWRLLGIRITVWVAGLIIGVVAVVAVVLFSVATLGIGLICLLPVLCLLIPLGIAVDAYIVLTMVAAIEEGARVFDAFGKAWVFVQKNLGQVLVMALILVIGGGILSAILFLPFAVVVVPAIVGGLTGSDTGLVSGLAISGLCLVVLLPVAVLLSGVLTTYITGVWTLTYRRLTGKPGAAALASAAAKA